MLGRRDALRRHSLGKGLRTRATFKDKQESFDVYQPLCVQRLKIMGLALINPNPLIHEPLASHRFTQLGSTSAELTLAWRRVWLQNRTSCLARYFEKCQFWCCLPHSKRIAGGSRDLGRCGHLPTQRRSSARCNHRFFHAHCGRPL